MRLCGLFAVFYIQLVNCARILVVLPTPILSHNIIYRTIYKELSLRGHEVLVFTPDPLGDDKLTNLIEIDMSYLYTSVDNTPTEFSIGISTSHQYAALKISREILIHPNMKILLQKPKTRFDLFLMEWNGDPSLGILSRIFDCPMIGVRSLGLTLDGHDFIGNPTNPSYIPNGLTDFDGSFWSRVHNFLFGIIWRINYHFYTLPKSQDLINELFPKDAVDVLGIQKNASLLLTNTHPVFTGVRPIVPANIEVGGVHLRKEVEPIPKEILNFLDQANEGVVYINLGSSTTNIPNLTPRVVNVIVSALSQLPYKIVWRWEQSELTTSLNNALILRWLPQQAILGHPNIKAFLTNGGLQSFLEAVDNMVPLVGIPLFADQHINVRKMEALQIGRRLDVNTLNKNILINAIKKVAEIPKYKKNIKKAAIVLHDLPMKPLVKAIWWIEYVLRHKGAHHLRSKAVDMNWITYLLLDVFAFMAICLFITLLLIYYLIAWIRSTISLLKYKYFKAKAD